MSDKAKAFYIAGCLIGIASILISTTSAAQHRQILKKEISIQVENTSLTRALHAMAVQNQIAIGVEEIVSSKPYIATSIDRKVSFNFKKKALGELLNDLFSNDNMYFWEIIDEMVIIKPRSEGTSITSTIISQFQVINVTEDEARLAIMNLPELQDQLKARGLSNGPVMTMRVGPPRTENITLNVKNVSLLAILNSIAKTTYFWHIFYLEGKMYIVI